MKTLTCSMTDALAKVLVNSTNGLSFPSKTISSNTTMLLGVSAAIVEANGAGGGRGGAGGGGGTGSPGADAGLLTTDPMLVADCWVAPGEAARSSRRDVAASSLNDALNSAET